MGIKKRKTIAIMMGNAVWQFLSDLIKGFRISAEKEDVDLVFFMGPHISTASKDVLSGSFEWNYEYQFYSIYEYVNLVKPDAIIVAYGSLSNFRYMSNIEQFVKKFTGIPLILLGDNIPHSGIPCVTTGNYGGMRACIEHLVVEHKYKDIAFVAGPIYNFDSNERVRAYRDVLMDHGISIDENKIVCGNYLDNIEYIIEGLLDNYPKLEAIVFASDNMARAGYRVCSKRNLVVGKDIAITGFDDCDIAKTLEPQLTSVSFSSLMVSHKALLAALELCDGSVPESIDLQARFHKRISCGCKNQMRRIETATSKEEAISLLKKRIDSVVDEMFFTIPYKEEKEKYLVLLHTFFFNIITDVYHDMEDFQLDMIINVLREMCDSPYISRSLLLEYLEKIFAAFILYAPKKEMHLTLDKYLNWTRRYIYSVDKENLEEENTRKEQNMWFLPSFTGDLIHTQLDLKQRMLRIMNRLQAMKIKSVYLYMLKEKIVHKQGESFPAPEDMYLVAYYNEKEMVSFDIDDIKKINQENGMLECLLKDKARNYTVLPIFSNEEQYGVMLCEATQEEYPFLVTCCLELGTLHRIVYLNFHEKQMQRELEEKNEILNMISTHDELTNLLNRRGFMESAIETIAKNKGKKAWLMFADIDHLKEINDSFGHGDGDFAICTAANYLNHCLPNNALKARMGGDEFGALMIIKDESSHSSVVVDQMKEFSRRFNDSSDKPYVVEMSAGIYEFVCDDQVNLSTLFRYSDEILYEEKKKRRKSIKKVMAKKYYVVKVGVTSGIYTSWDECKKMVDGYPKAVYKGFNSLEDAEEYLAKQSSNEESEKNQKLPEHYAFVDGSYTNATKTYGYGGFLYTKGQKIVLQGSGNEEEMASMRNVAGEILGSMAAIKKAMELGLPELTIYYDYMGIEMWATGDWKRNKKGTIAYYEFMQEIKNKISVHFVKVKGHSGIEGNEEADRLAKEAVGIL